MRVGVLGAVEVSLAGAPVDLGTRKQRALLAALALHRGRAVAVDTLVDLLWADHPPPGVAGTLQAYVAGLRRALEPDRPARAQATRLVTEPPGYALRLPSDALDMTRFETVVSQTHERLSRMAVVPAGGSVGLSDAELQDCVHALDGALALWRGRPFQELDEAPAAVAERVRLEELRLVALEDRITAALGLGRQATVAAELEALTGAHPLRERLWALRAVALARSGRQAEALEVLQQVRRLLVDELGIEPGAEIREVQAAVLRQDALLGPAPGLPVSVPTPTGAGPVAATAQHPVGRPTWPLVGRTEELAALRRLVQTADDGTPAFAALIGDPGMGKSRLAHEAAELARDRGARVLVGRCSQDEGAPPLWPWRSVLAGLGATLPVESGTEDEGTRFRSWDDICARLLDAARDETVLVILDDLHWADVSSLRVLGLLLEKAQHGRLAVLATWRDKPQPVGALAAVAEGFARKHAARLHLAGLDRAEVAQVVHAVAAATPSEAQAAALQARTDGNPFFLVEYARLVEEGGDLASLLDEPHPPAAVSDVLSRRLERLPDATARILRIASVVGRDFDLATVSIAARLDEEAALDLLEAALDAGLVVDVGGDRFRFAHALVRDTAYSALSPSRRARAHSLVAEALVELPGRETEVALHWAAAGPAHAGRAWRAAGTAAEQARVVYAYDEAEDLLRKAVELLDDDPGATTRDEFELLMSLATTLQLAGKWLDLRVVVHRMIELATWLDDVELLAQAAVIPSNGALWQAANHGETDEPTVAALRRVLAELPQQDSPERCRALLSLSSEIYYGVSPQEREALAEEGVAMARRLGDPALLLSACQIAFVSTWRAATADSRLRLADEAIAIARSLGDDSAVTAALTVRAAVAGELGDVETMERLCVEARRRAELHHQLYSLVVLDSMEVAWMAMRGEWEDARRVTEHLVVTGQKMALAQYADATAGAMLSVGMWQHRYDDLLPVLVERDTTTRLPGTPLVSVVLARLGRLDEARAYLAEHPLELEVDNWFSMLPLALSAEVALALGDKALAEKAYSMLAPYSGRSVSAGSGVAAGPVDAYLALAAAATGETALATRHADQALETCARWRIPLAAQWLRDQRERYGF